MAITAAVCDAYYEAILKGTHRESDAYWIALYGPSASLSAATTTYTPSGEVSASGDYEPGGVKLDGFTTGKANGAAYVDWTTNPLWVGVTFAARGALVYNRTRGNAACAVLDFGETLHPKNAPFVVELPPPGPTATIHIRLVK